MGRVTERVEGRHSRIDDSLELISYACDGLNLLFFGECARMSVNYVWKLHDIRDAVYSHADKITPETLKHADDLISNMIQQDFGWLNFIFLGVGFYTASNIHFHRWLRDKQENT